MHVSSKIKKTHEITLTLEQDELDRLIGAVNTAIDELGDVGFVLCDFYNALTIDLEEE